MTFKKKNKKNISPRIKIACQSPKKALLSSKSTTHRGKNYVAFFKSAFGAFLAFFRVESGIFRSLASGNAALWLLIVLVSCGMCQQPGGFARKLSTLVLTP
jgi:hypothetical protein